MSAQPSAVSTGYSTRLWTRRCGKTSSPEIPPRASPCPRRKRPKQILNDAQLEQFMEVIRADSVWHDFFYTELTTGLRQGEICGLMWSDFDETHGTLSIRRTIHTQKGGSWLPVRPRRVRESGSSSAAQHRPTAGPKKEILLLPVDLPKSAPTRAARQSRHRLQSLENPAETGGGCPVSAFMISGTPSPPTPWPAEWMPRPCRESWAILRRRSPSIPTPM